jgi:hypothetical protein
VLTPIIFKKTPLLEIFRGIKTQLIVSVYGMVDPYTLAVLLLLLFSNLSGLASLRPEISNVNRNVVRSQLILLVCLYFFYNFTNRNFFAETRRYYLPLEYLGFVLVLTEWGFLHQPGKLMAWLKNQLSLTQNQTKIDARSLLPLFMISLVLILANQTIKRWNIRDFRDYDRDAIWHKIVLIRENPFSVMAKVTKNLVPHDWRLATTELHGYGFLLDLEIDPLFGYANRKIASSKLMNESFGFKINPDYLFDSKPDILWNGQILQLNLPVSLNSQYTKKLLELFTICGIDSNRILEEYPAIYIIQNPTDRNIINNTILLVRKDRINAFEASLKSNEYQKYADFPFHH